MRSRFMTMGISAALACVAAAGQVSAAPLPGWVPSQTQLDAMIQEALRPFEWTTLVPSPDSRLIFVSSSEGNDANDGLSPERPVRTIARGCELLRDGEPDWLLLKRGDVWEENIGWWGKSGRSASERMVVTSYGEGDRPRLLTGTSSVMSMSNNTPRRFLAFTGFSATPHERTPSDSPSGMIMLSGGQDVLLEDLEISGYKDNIVIQGGAWKNVAVRGCVVTDAWSATSHSQGIFVRNTEGLVVEGCVFDHNGWNESVAGAEATIFNHNMYLQTKQGPAVVRGNFVARASSHGLQARSGGDVSGNVWVLNALNILLGGGKSPTPGGVSGRVVGNAIVAARDLSATAPRGLGIQVVNISEDGVVVARNLLGYNQGSGPRGIQIQPNGNAPAVGVQRCFVTQNVMHEWGRGVEISQPDEGQVLEDVVVLRNQFSGSTTQMMAKAPADALGVVTFAGNLYSCGTPSANAFQLAGDGKLDFHEWVATVEQDAQWDTAVSLPSTLPELLRWAPSDIASGSLEDLIEHFRGMQRGGEVEPDDIARLRRAWIGS